jgi:hypothetical protein
MMNGSNGAAGGLDGRTLARLRARRADTRAQRWAERLLAPLLARLPAIAPALPLRLQLVHGLARATRARSVQRLQRFPAFRLEDYLALNPDVARGRVKPAFHALFLGACEGRPLFRPETLARTLGEQQRRGLALAAPRAFAGRPAGLRVGLYASSQGNVFMREILSDLAASLAAVGTAVEVGDETAPIERRPPLSIFVAPHEFFILGAGRRWIREDVIARAVMLNTEQVQTRWFALALPFLLAARGVIDLCAQMRDLLAAAGVPALHLTMAPPLAPAVLAREDRDHALFRALPEDARADPQATTPLAERPIDIAFFGAASRHRDAFFARHAAFFADYETFFYCRRVERGPIRADGAESGLARLAQHVGGHAKIVLNLHRDEYGYFEWHRIVRLGLCTGSVVVSEPCLPHPLIRAGEHYFEASARQMPNLIEWLLQSDDGRAAAQAMQASARRLLAETLDPARTAMDVLGWLHDA